MPTRFKSALLTAALIVAACITPSCQRESEQPQQAQQQKPEPQEPRRVDSPAPSPPIVAAARDQIGKTVRYDPSYVGLEYPMGDVPIDRGVCTDVIIRALRSGIGLDLQQLVHEDMKSAFSAYPKIWGLRRPDRNIDHRRVPNLRRFFQRKQWSLPPSQARGDYLPGDIVTCKVSNRDHIMIVSDRKNDRGTPLAIHNIGSGAVEDDSLLAFAITGHYRIPSPEGNAQ